MNLAQQTIGLHQFEHPSRKASQDPPSARHSAQMSQRLCLRLAYRVSFTSRTMASPPTSSSAQHSVQNIPLQVPITPRTTKFPPLPPLHPTYLKSPYVRIQAHHPPPQHPPPRSIKLPSQQPLYRHPNGGDPRCNAAR